MTGVNRARTARNSREHRRSNDRSTASNGGDSIQHEVDALFPYAPMRTSSIVKNKIVIGDAGHIRA